MAERAFELEGVVSGYGTLPVLNLVSVAIHKKRVTAVIGPNGSGKSTLLLCLFGLLPIWSGKATFLGNDVSQLSQREMLTKGVVYLPQGQKVFPHLTVRQNIEVGFLYSDNKVGDLEKRLEPFLDWLPNLPELLDEPAANLSGGERQIVGLVRVFLVDATILLLDEPSLNLAPDLAYRLFRMIEASADQYGKTIVLVEQRVRPAMRIADDVIVVKRGEIAFDGPVDDLDQGDLKKFFG